jgi:hypothetical protein
MRVASLTLDIDLRNELAQNSIIDDRSGKSSTSVQRFDREGRANPGISTGVAERRGLD